MKLKTILDSFHSTLDDCYGKDEVNSFFDMLMEHILGIKRIELVLNPHYNVSIKEFQLFSKALDELKQNKPIQYIIGETEFYGMPFKVNQYTLIPRPETEELVDWILKCHSKQRNNYLKILDIGTGTGCIPIALAKHMPTAKVFALDISREALDVANENATQNNVNVNFIHDDILDTRHDELVSAAHNFDIIVSNPPYVRQLEKKEIKSNVLDFEPHMALFVDDDNPLLFYKAICQFAQKYLRIGGVLYFEINEYLGKEMLSLVQGYGFKNAELKQDIFGKNRMLRAIK